MDLLNKKKLIEKENEIQDLKHQKERLKREVEALDDQISNLQVEKEKESKLHQEVVDTILQEVKALIADNYHKKISFKTSDTLLPLIKEIVDTKNFTVFIDVKLRVMFKKLPSDKHKLQALSLAFSKIIINNWKTAGFVEEAFAEPISFDGENPYSGKPSDFLGRCEITIFSKFDFDEFRYKVNRVPKKSYEVGFESNLFLVETKSEQTETGLHLTFEFFTY